jgi:hypothetical protein
MTNCGAGGGMRIGRRNRSTRRKPVPVLLCPPQIAHDLRLGSNPGRRGGKPTKNHIIYGRAPEDKLKSHFLIQAQY